MKIITAAFFFFSSFVFAQQAPNDWIPEDQIPKKIKYIGGEPNAELLAQGKKIVGELVQLLHYVKEHGDLPDPPDLGNFLHFISYKSVTLGDVYNEVGKASGYKAPVKEILAEWRWLNSSKFAQYVEQTLGQLSPAQRGNVTKDQYLSYLFDQYLQMKMGFAVKNSAKALLEEGFVGQYEQYPNSSFIQDNAFFVPLPVASLKEVLDEHVKRSVTLGRVSPEKLFDLQYFFHLMQEAPVYTSLIVTSPRTFADKINIDDPEEYASTDVSLHEYGHQVNHWLNKYTGRTVNEVYADYIAWAVTGDPKIGEYFVAVGGKIADIYLSQSDIGPNETLTALAMQRMAKKGHLRDFEDYIRMIDLSRNISLENAYSSGNPIRTFLGELGTGLSVDFDRFSGLQFQVIKRLPKSYRPYSQAMAKEVVEVENRILSAQAERQRQFREKYYFDYTKRLHNEGHPVEIKNGLTIEDFRNQFFADQFREIAIAFAESEERLLNQEIEARKAGLIPISEPVLKIDYLVPEYLRAFYFAAKERYPEIIPLFENKVEEVFAKKMVVVSTKGGQPVPFFVPLSADNYATAKFFKGLADKYVQAVDRLDQEAKGKKASSKMVAAEKNYLSLLEEILLYERTGKRTVLPVLARQKLGFVLANSLNWFSQTMAGKLTFDTIMALPRPVRNKISRPVQKIKELGFIAGAGSSDCLSPFEVDIRTLGNQ